MYLNCLISLLAYTYHLSPTLQMVFDAFEMCLNLELEWPAFQVRGLTQRQQHGTSATLVVDQVSSATWHLQRG